MPWAGIGDAIDAYGRMRVRVRGATAEIAVEGAKIIMVAAQANILSRFVNRTGDLFRSMYSDAEAKPLGENWFTARAFPRGPGSTEGTPYGRIQELGGEIFPHNPTGLLWFDSIREGGGWGVISVPEVTLFGRFYLRDATLESLGILHSSAARHWRDAV